MNMYILCLLVLTLGNPFVYGAAPSYFESHSYEEVLEMISNHRRELPRIPGFTRGGTFPLSPPTLDSRSLLNPRGFSFSPSSVSRTITSPQTREEDPGHEEDDSIFTLYRPRGLKVAPDLGWKLHITAQLDPRTVDTILSVAVPFLLSQEVLFKIPRSFKNYSCLFESPTQSGKLITIYPCRGEDSDRLERFAQDLNSYLNEHIRRKVLNKKMFIPLIHEMQIGESSGLYARYGSCSGLGRGLEEDRLSPWPPEYHDRILLRRPFEELNPKIHVVGCFWNSWVPFSKLYPAPKTAKVMPAESSLGDVGTPMTDCSEVEKVD